MCKFESNFEVLDKIVALNLDVTLWTGRKKLEAQDLGGVNLPPEDLASLGSKRIADPEKLKVFSTIKCRAASFLDKHGVRFLGGWGIPVTKIGMVIDELVKRRAEFEKAKETFLAEYDQSLKNWIDSHTQWANIIRNSTVSADYVRARLTFGWQSFQVVPFENRDNPSIVAESGLAEAVENVADTLYGEVAHAAKDMWVRVFEGRTEVTQKALSPLRTLRDKMAGLSFVEPHVTYVVDIIEGALKRMPDKGAIKDTDLLLLHGLVNLLQDGDALMKHSLQIIDGYGPATVLDDLLRQATPTPSVVPTKTVSKDTNMVATNTAIAHTQSVPRQPVPMPPPAAAATIPSMGLF